MNDMTMQSDLIIDVGMHTGKDTLFYLQKGFRVVAIEANPGRRFKTRIRLVYSFTGQNLVLVRDSGFGIRDSGFGPLWITRFLF